MTTIRRRRGFAAALAVAALMLLPAAPALAFAQSTQENLDQIIDPNQAQGTGRVVLDDGHIDYGPTLNTGEWIIQIHDDTSSPSYWRMPSDVVAKVNDGSMLTIPEDPAYAFLELEAGKDVWVIPQVRQAGVVWAGWNTQEPTVLDNLSMGTTQRVLGVEGPGEVSVYLQSGNFGEPQSLWSTHEAFPQESWIEVNTHTHANWVFSEPGIYLVELEFEGMLVDGSTVTARDTLRFSVGDATDAEGAFEKEFDDSLIADAEDEAGGGSSADPDASADNAAGDNGNLALVIGVVAGAIALALLVAIIVIVTASRRAKARSRATRAARTAEHVESDPPAEISDREGDA